MDLYGEHSFGQMDDERISIALSYSQNITDTH